MRHSGDLQQQEDGRDVDEPALAAAAPVRQCDAAVAREPTADSLRPTASGRSQTGAADDLAASSVARAVAGDEVRA